MNNTLIVLKFPFWELSALVIDVPQTLPCVEYEGNRVTLVSPQAYDFGIRPGMSLSRAYDLCQDLHAVPPNSDRSARAFEVVASAVSSVVNTYYLLEPGVVVIPFKFAQRNFETMEDLGEEIIEVIAEYTGAECMVGGAQGLLAAILAADEGMFVSSGTDKKFLAHKSIRQLFCVLPNDADTHNFIEELELLGLVTLNDIQKIGKTAMIERFSSLGYLAWKAAQGEDLPVEWRPYQSEKQFMVRRDIELYQREAIIMAYRQLSVKLCEALRRENMACELLSISCITADDRVHERMWSFPGTQSDTQITQRCLWQVDGWLGQIGTITSIELSVLQAAPAAQSLQDPLWGRDTHKEKVSASAQHIDALFGQGSVCIPHIIGGFEPRGRIDIRPFIPGEEKF